jgi:hypothetical protein
MELATETRPAATWLRGEEVFTLSPGQKVRIQYGAVGSPTESLLATVPQGKTWEVRVTVHIVET